MGGHVEEDGIFGGVCQGLPKLRLRVEFGVPVKSCGHGGWTGACILT